MRLDKTVFQRGLAQSRSRAEELIARGDVLVNGAVCQKPSLDVSDEDEITVSDSIGFVSRAGSKLLHALRTFSLDCAGLTALDIGASTGGFTQCLLRNGAAHVWAVDVGHGQMAPSLSRDPRVSVLEGVNARTLTPEMIFGKKQFAVMDVSFISQTMIYPALFSCVEDNAPVVTLLKPQFEAGKKALDKHGVFRDYSSLPSVFERVEKSAQTFGYGIDALCISPIMGSDGNREFLLSLKRGAQPFDYQSFCKEIFS